MSDEMKVERYGPRGMYVRHIDFERLQQQLAAAREALQAAEADKGKVYEEGWRCAALWACRNDLISDIGSPEYERDKQDAIATIQRDRQP